MRPVRSAARALLSGIFVVSGARSLANPEPFVDRARRVTDRVGPVLANAHPKLPTEPEPLVRLNGALQVAGGLLLATGHLTRPAAAVLAGTLVPTTLAGHPFWTIDDPAERRIHQVHFLKNLGLLGGLLLAAVDTEGRPGLRYRTSHAVGRTERALGRSGRSVRRSVRTARREARIAVRSAAAARRLPG
ncbi:DoxX family protein [Solwaraspora sp. WMMD1047]|jgi:putative oxidoreductase|uniref:DoxX family protein n=1 Tax=Solwaraspora sp. WMMD1047 TaxID=3016102 RepID=UPI002417A701|nr:DoxX family protein [Solwaraspora sp. WMMD1047]MDG4834778.1 DoxX family protein [Solwaraspora sp. WMMD1047]